jgi:23S rRNA pseudouridine1911/1915/1917 synthase
VAKEFIVGEGAVAAGTTLASALRQSGLATTWNEARRLCTSGKVRVGAAVELDPARRLDRGAHVEVVLSAARPQRGPAYRVVFEDAHVVVVAKPAGLSTVPFATGPGERAERNTLVDLLRDRQRGKKGPGVGVVHRIDKDTSGLVLFAKGLRAERALAAQFRAHTVERRYLALVLGELQSTVVRASLIRDRGDGRRGVGEGHGAKPAVTHVEAMERLDGATQVACRLETGRTHQVRLHLAHLGHPILGDRVYTPRSLEIRRDLAPEAIVRQMLHAQTLGFVHPVRDEMLRFEEPPPDDFRALLESLRR